MGHPGYQLLRFRRLAAGILVSFERHNIHRMSGYVSGEQPPDPLTIKLNTNENPYPPSPKVDEVLQKCTASELRRYPPATAKAFREAAASLHGLDADQVVATRGGDELLRLVITTFVEPGETIAMTDPTYSLYPVLSEIQDCPVTTLALDDSWDLPDGFAEEMNRRRAKLTFIVNPHAPSGNLVPIETLGSIAGTLDKLLLIDEAYIDFAPEGSGAVRLINEFDNVIVLRTMSKGYSLAGLRFGYGLGSPELIAPILHKTRDSYNLDLLGQRIAIAALLDQPYARATRQKVIDEREKLRALLAAEGLSSPPSAANFLLATVPCPGDRPGKGLYHYLRERNILVRYFDADRLEDKIRISVGLPWENEALIEHIRAYCGEQ